MIQEKALLVSLSLGLPPVAKTDKRITGNVLAEHGTTKGWARAVKRLLPEQALEPIKKLHHEADEYYRKRTCAWSDRGERILASHLFMEFSAKLAEFAEQTKVLVDDFVRGYDDFIEEARTQLNGAFNAGDYLDRSLVRGRFKFDVEFRPVPDGGDFRISVMREAMDDLRESVNRRVAQATRAAQCDLAKRVATPLAKMVTALSNPEATFKDSLTGNLREICDLIPALNITGDPALEEVRKQIYTELYRADADLLRQNPTVRSSTARKAQNILDKMNGYFSEVAA